MAQWERVFDTEVRCSRTEGVVRESVRKGSVEGKAHDLRGD
jgi:hypothetical protein